MLDGFLLQLRGQGVKVGVSEWLVFLDGLKRGLAQNLSGLYYFGRSVLVKSETQFDAYDLAFQQTFSKDALDPKWIKEAEAWIESLQELEDDRFGQHDFESLEELLEAMKKTLEAQTEQHHGGNRWVGTGGTSPYGTGGRANQGVQLGGHGGGRSGVRLAEARRWQNYRTDVSLGVRDFKVALKALRKLAREGQLALDLDETIDKTSKMGGEIELVLKKERLNKVRLVLLMDSGGSMSPHTTLVSKLLTAAKETKLIKSLDCYYFHNCVYEWLYVDYETGERLRVEEVLAKLGPDHRLMFVGDASMASWELFSGASWLGRPGPSGLDRLKTIKQKCPSSVWMNPDPKRFWDHPTVSAIGLVFPMFSLSIDGLREAIDALRKKNG